MFHFCWFLFVLLHSRTLIPDEASLHYVKHLQIKILEIRIRRQSRKEKKYK